MAGDWERAAETCPAAWTITCRHDGTLVLHHCDAVRVDPVQEAIARRMIAGLSLDAREDLFPRCRLRRLVSVDAWARRSGPPTRSARTPDLDAPSDTTMDMSNGSV